MSERLVVHCKRSQYDVYVGRSTAFGHRHEHYGNPFSHKPLGHCIQVTDRREAIRAFEAWLLGDWLLLSQITKMDVDVVQKIEPIRRRWVINNLKSLDGKVLGCWCEPAACHADVLTQYARLSSEEFTAYLARVLRSQSA